MKVIIPFTVGIVSAFLITVAVILPGWMVKEYYLTGYHVYISLFYGVICLDTCRLASFREIYHFDNGHNMFWMLEFHAEVILSILLTVIAVVVLFQGQKRYINCKRLSTATVFFIIAGILIFMGCGRIIQATVLTNHQMINEPGKVEGKEKFHFTIPFSLLPALIGGVLQFTAALLTFFLRRDVKQKRDSARIELYDIWDTKIEPLTDPDLTNKNFSNKGKAV